jgi:putative ABC transport system permease protein
VLRREVQAVVPGLPYVDVGRLADRLDPQARPWTAGAGLLSLFGVLALVLATIGIFAAVSSEVASRRHELGVRLALGAGPGDAVWLVTKLGVVPAAVGAGLGLAIALTLSRYVEPLLFAVRVGDPWTAAAVTLALVTAALLATCPPARRVRRIDPATELRAE